MNIFKVYPAAVKNPLVDNPCSRFSDRAKRAGETSRAGKNRDQSEDFVGEWLLIVPAQDHGADRPFKKKILGDFF